MNIEKFVDGMDDIGNIARSMSKARKVGRGIGLIAGAIGGVILCENAISYIETLTQTPMNEVIRYSLDVISATVSGGTGAIVTGFLAPFPWVYKGYKRHKILIVLNSKGDDIEYLKPLD